MNDRIKNEIEHSKLLLAEHKSNWGWFGPAGERRLKERVKLLTKDIPAQAKVLEIGCGLGYYSFEFAQLGFQLTSLDISPFFIEQNLQKNHYPNLEFVVGDAHQLQYENNTFDYVIGCSVLHHLDIEAALSEIRRVLAPQGRIYFSEPNMLNPQVMVQKNIPLIKKFAGDSPDETAFFRWKLAQKLNSIGFTDIEVKPFDFLHPSTPALLIEPINKLSHLLSSTPLVKEFAGSLFITAKKGL